MLEDNVKQNKKDTNKKKKKKAKAFTLIELLAVIIILGILLIIAIPSVTTYISNSRKSAYVDTAKEIVSGARTLVNSGKLDMYDRDTTYYISAVCIPTEVNMSSPYGKFVDAYVIVGYTGDGFVYYWASVDSAHQGIEMKEYDKLEMSDVKPGVEMIDTNIGIGERSKIRIIDDNCKTFGEPTSVTPPTNPTDPPIDPGSQCPSTTIPSGPVCKKATTLHKKTCQRDEPNFGCSPEIGYGNTITYGTIVNGSLKAGDAFDCKVTVDGDYTERFYYIKSEGNNAILLYYKNINDQAMYAYDYSNKNNKGPTNAYTHLPSTCEWNNPKLIAPGTRNIVNEVGGNSTPDGTIESFTYTNRAARLLTISELSSACGSSDLDNCTYVLENIGYYETSSGTRSYGYWLENPTSYRNKYVYRVYGSPREVTPAEARASADVGVRPVITINLSDLEY